MSDNERSMRLTFSIDDVDIDDREVVVDDVNVNFDVDVDVIIDDFLKMLIER